MRRLPAIDLAPIPVLAIIAAIAALAVVLGSIVTVAPAVAVPRSAMVPPAGALSSGAPSSGAPWRWPVRGPHPIIRPFIAPATDFGPGHRGIDVAATNEVLAPAAGTVHFAGTVVDRPVISLDHGGGIFSSFEPVSTTLRIGDSVTRGQVIGRIRPGHCSEPCLHLGVRVNGGYVSPLLFLGGVVHSVLLPTRRVGGALASSRPRVRPRVALFEPLGRDVRVQLSGAEAGVAEHFLHRPQVGPAVEQMGRGRVTKGVGSGWPGSREVGEKTGDQLIDRSGADPPAAGAEEYGVGPLVGEFVPVRQVVDDRALGWSAEWHHSLLRSLSQDTHRESFEIETCGIESDDLANPKRGGVEQLHDREVASRDGLTCCGARGEASEQAVDLIPAEYAGKMMIGFGGTQARCGIVGRDPGSREPDRKATRSRGPPCQSRFREPGVGAVPEPVPKQFEVDAVGRDDAAPGCESGEVGQIGAIRPHGVRAETTLGGQVDRELSDCEIEAHPIIVTHPRSPAPQACRVPDRPRWG